MLLQVVGFPRRGQWVALQEATGAKGRTVALGVGQSSIPSSAGSNSSWQGDYGEAIDAFEEKQHWMTRAM